MGTWRKSSRSGAGNDCVELLPGGATFRDTKSRHIGGVSVPPLAGASFLSAVAIGRFDRPQS